jgi:hypothetical protein
LSGDFGDDDILEDGIIAFRAGGAFGDPFFQRGEFGAWELGLVLWRHVGARAVFEGFDEERTFGVAGLDGFAFVVAAFFECGKSFDGETIFAILIIVTARAVRAEDGGDVFFVNDGGVCCDCGREKRDENGEAHVSVGKEIRERSGATRTYPPPPCVFRFRRWR